ncbi:MAG: KilA-N domain-containing protein [Candidatus Nitrotoga sp. LAW]|nr:MAG: KilA-N domain-containing protein [Candidatus Nitrotoga sp. LAW]
MIDVVKAEFDGVPLTFTEDGWFNATEVADKYKRRVADWLENIETQDYLSALLEILKVPKVALLKTRRGRYGGTWMHPRLAVAFARWLDVRFGVWCDDQIFQILSGQHIHYDWKKSRHETSASFKVLGQVLQLTRQRSGKTCAPHHFSNEALMINWALTGKFVKIDRNGLSADDLDLLAKLENMDTVLIGCGTSYEDRKEKLEQFANEHRNRATTSRLQSIDLPWAEVAPFALGKPALEPGPSPDVIGGQSSNG